MGATTPEMFKNENKSKFDTLLNALGRKSMIWGGDAYNYALLASGHLDLVVEAGLKIHDYAALVPVIEGAGGIITDWQGNILNAESDGRVFAAATKELHEEALRFLRS